MPATKGPSTANRKPRGPNFNLIHSKSLPLDLHPCPAFIPNNPLSYVHIAWHILRAYLYPPTSHPVIYIGEWSPGTRSIHVHDANHVRALWEMGFFGKGSLSRSEPTWLSRERKRIGLVTAQTSEEITNQRRQQREALKRERAKVEAAIVEQQKRKDANDGVHLEPELQPFSVRAATIEAQQAARKKASMTNVALPQTASNLEVNEPENLEHLQLSPEEAFFLSYALGVLQILDRDQKPIEDSSALLSLYRRNSYFPSIPCDQLAPDDPFLLKYVVYHHFRSLGWVVRDGIKFAVDYLLYERGPVFKHAAFAIMIIPSYTHSHWQSQTELTRNQKLRGSHEWSWLHCINRVQTQVLKTLILVYVDIPSPSQLDDKNIGAMLKSYRVREVCVSRWSANRNR